MADPSVSVSVSSKVDGDKPTRGSLWKASSPKSGGMILPRYLQPSSGSCHDFCKYGKHHEFEKKSWLQSQRRSMKTPGAKHFSVEFPEETKKKAVNNLKHQPDSKTHVLDTPEIIKREVLTTSVNMEGSRLNHKKTSEETLTKADGSHSSVKRVTAKKKTPLQQLNLLEGKSSVSSGVDHHERKNLSIHGKKRRPSDKPRTSPGLKSGLSSPIRKQNTSATSEKFRVFSELASLRLGVDLSPKQTISSKQISSSVDALELSSGGRVSHIKMGPRTEMPRIMVKKGHASPRGSFSPKRSTSSVPRKVSSNNGVTRGFSSPGASLSPKVSPSRVARGFLSPRISLTSKVSHSRNASLNAKKHGGPKDNSPPKILNKIETDGKANADRPDRKIVDPGHPISNLKEPNNDMVREKTLYVIKVETESNYINSDVNEKVSMESSPPLSSASPRPSSPPNSPSSPVHNSQDDESEVRGQFVPQESMEMTPSTLVLDISTPWSENPSTEARVEENSDYDESGCAEDEKVSVESSPPPSSVSPRASFLPNCPSWPVHNNQDNDESENSSIEAKEEASSDYYESECSKYEKVSMESCPPPSSASLRASALPNSPSLPVLNNQENEESENSSTEAKEEANSDYDESKCAKCEKAPMESFPPPLSASPRASSPPNSPSFPVHNSQDNDESENSSTEAKEEENSDYDESDSAEDERVSMESSPPSSSSPSSLPNSPSLPVHNNQDDDESENPSTEAEEEENSDYDESECAEDEKVSMESSSPPTSASPRASSPPNSPSSPVHNDQDNDKSENLSTEAKGEANSDYDESERAKDAVALKGAHRGRQRNGRLVLSEDKDCPPVKLRFRRGKVVDLLSESRSPRRLKFRRGRVLGENKNLKNHDTINFKTEAYGKANDCHESVKVVLRHQNVQRKKNAQRLFNNVIEETASKLVETRKSKVKALVGAFESVISLQDSKPSSNMVP